MIETEPTENPMRNDMEVVSKNTHCYLDKYLDPNKIWNKRIHPKQRINRIRFAKVDWEIVAAYIKEMDYRLFLKTPYWSAIAAHAKYKAGYKCQLCSSSYRLVAHHRNYSVHGREHAHFQELIVLCDKCHNKFHDTPLQTSAKPKSEEMVLLKIVLILSAFLFFMISVFNQTQNSDFDENHIQSFVSYAEFNQTQNSDFDEKHTQSFVPHADGSEPIPIKTQESFRCVQKPKHLRR